MWAQGWGRDSPREGAIMGVVGRIKSTGSLMRCLQQKGSFAPR